MKTISFLVLVGFFSIPQLEARDLTYKFGTGFRQSYTGARVSDAGVVTAEQVSGLEVSFGFAPDLLLGGFVGFLPNVDFAMTGPSLRYNFQRLLNREASIWNHLNLYAQADFFIKFGRKSESGLTLHAPYLGFEVFPFEANHFSISSQAGLVLDFVKANRFGFTQGLLGDLGIKYYF
jgi:hypothetical protein